MSGVRHFSSHVTGIRDQEKNRQSKIQKMSDAERTEYAWLDDFKWDKKPLWNEEQMRISKGIVNGGDMINDMFHLGSGRYSFKIIKHK